MRGKVWMRGMWWMIQEGGLVLRIGIERLHVALTAWYYRQLVTGQGLTQPEHDDTQRKRHSPFPFEV